MTPQDDIERELDPRRWITLGVLVITVILVAMDTSVLNVSIPTMLRDLNTTVPSLEWVIAGYSLTFASLLIIGGRLGDIFGHRRLFMIGVSLFGTGSLIAALSPPVGWLILGEAVIEGIGAAMMVPATLSLLSTIFHGKERATAFAAWGAAAGAAVAFGPVLGGWLTTNYTWRWAFGINVIIAPIALLGGLVLMRPSERGPRIPIDIPGAALIASGMFLVVFALSQSPTYGWLAPHEALTVGSVTLWPDTMPLSITFAAFVLGVVMLGLFAVVERRKEAADGDPLFEFGQLRYRTYRYGLFTAVVIALGQLGLLFALPLFLQSANGLSAEENGLWMLPLGTMMIVGAQVGGKLNHRFGTTNVVRVGFFIEALALFLIIPFIEPGVGFWTLIWPIGLFGLGVGAASGQLTNLVLSEIPIEKTGVASGANSTARQLGAALGAAIIGSLITVQTTKHAVQSVQAAGLPQGLTDTAVRGIDAMGANWQVPSQAAPDQAATMKGIFDSALTSGVRWAIAFAAALVLAGAFVSLLIPQVRPVGGRILVGDEAKAAGARAAEARREAEVEAEAETLQPFPIDAR
jgi:EmrB/QacA subfamily drug resistance transporter